ncbi:CHAT domain-containing protein [Pseudorhodoferax sp.]|uniref:CHAT domain-containing protein n=1 Tax=Pseudorhodoferax sp. TaxID=1993553 RepID=UPI002DD673D9|nr:CHAT domain-containing protein [Pseudorhodoferax sp.]
MPSDRLARTARAAPRALSVRVAALVLAAALGPAAGWAAGSGKPASPTSAAVPATPFEQGLCQLRQGQVRLATEQLKAVHAAADGVERARAAAALGQAWLRLNQPDEAEPLLEAAVAGLDTPRARAAAALDIGHLHLLRRQHERADAAWLQALQQAPADPELALAVELNRLGLPDALEAAQTLPRLQAAAQTLQQLPAGAVRTRHTLRLASLAQAQGAPGTELALRSWQAGRDAAVAAGDDGLAAEAYDGLASLYEAQQRPAEALQLTERGLRHAQRQPEPELLLPLQWRAGRLARLQGQDEQALAAYRRAVEHVEAVRSDMPVHYTDGRSSFRETLEPVYLGLTDALLRRAAQSNGSEQATLLRQARNTVELIKQTEMEDFMRNRCWLGGARDIDDYRPPPATAIYYPIILPDRLELLIETEHGIERTAVPVAGDELRRTAQNFVAALRAGQGFRSQAQVLYRWLLAPVQPRLQALGVKTLVAVPDGVLRLVPLAALHDGSDFAIRRWAMATVPGLTMLSAAPRGSANTSTLLAGMSEPGPVVDKLPAQVISAMLEGGSDAGDARGGDAAPAVQPARGPANAKVREALRDALALPGVKREIEDIAGVLASPALLDQGFTLAALQQQLAASQPAVVHIASHGVFGDSADTTFIMTYDELLTLDGLQALLAGAGARSSRPIELITLSACQTAEGDDRAPLGMSGTALKARARSALGTLWPVADNAAQRLMSNFYRQLAARGQAGGSASAKIEMLRAAQLDLLDQPQFRHPFYWAPFVLVGDWQ